MRLSRLFHKNPALKDYADGILVLIPLLPGVIPVGMIVGFVAAQVPLSALPGISQSGLIYAGASQLAIAQLIKDGALPITMILTGLIINLRLAIYSAAIAQHYASLPASIRLLIGFLLTDQSYALSVIHYNSNPNMTAAAKARFYLGGSLLTWFIWMGAVTAGFYTGAIIPSGWSLDFIVPLSFLTLLVPSVRDKATLVAAIVGATTAVVAHPLPFNLGLFIGALAGMVAGYVWERRHPPVIEPDNEEKS